MEFVSIYLSDEAVKRHRYPPVLAVLLIEETLSRTDHLETHLETSNLLTGFEASTIETTRALPVTRSIRKRLM